MKNNCEHIIETKDLTIGYSSKKNDIVIASNLNIKISAGKFICLLGKNGIGKSTLLRTLTNVQPSLKGNVFINDKNLKYINNSELSKEMSLVLTERLPDSNLSVFEIVALGRQPYTNWVGKLTEKDLHHIKNALKQTDTNHLIKRKHYELSDGQLQKVLIARALAQNTNLIFLDEPTAHLDIHHTIETFSLLKKLAEKFNKTIIISTHEINLALELANELWLMTPSDFISGKTSDLIQQNKISQLFDSKHIKYNKELNKFSIVKI